MTSQIHCPNIKIYINIYTGTYTGLLKLNLDAVSQSGNSSFVLIIDHEVISALLFNYCLCSSVRLVRFGIDGGGKLQAVGEEEALEESRAVVMSTVERRF